MPADPPVRPCPLCRRAAVAAYRHFCSRGCRDRDLLQWFGEDYRLPVRPGAEEGDDDAPPRTGPGPTGLDDER